MIYLNQTTPLSKMVDRVSGKYIYLVSLGNVIFNDTIFNYESVSIPIFSKDLFVLPYEVNKYAAINIYLNPVTGEVVYDKVAVFDKEQDSVDADCLFNVIPLAQFIIKQVDNSFDVIGINEYSRMGTFSVTTGGVTGAQGFTGLQGGTGTVGYKGIQGIQGITGIQGIQGPIGIVGQSIPGPIGPRGPVGSFI